MRIDARGLSGPAGRTAMKVQVVHPKPKPKPKKKKPAKKTKASS